MTIEQIVDESGKIYGHWKVIDYAGRVRVGKVGAGWNCKCTRCDDKKVITGTLLRTNKLPVCWNCCRKCGKTRAEVGFRTRLSKVCRLCRSDRIHQWRSRTDFPSKLQEWNRQNPTKRKSYAAKRLIKVQSSPYIFLSEMLRNRRTQYKALQAMIDEGRKPDPRSRSIDKKRTILINNIDLHRLWDAQDGKCKISGMSMAHKYNELRTVSIDRINCDKPYTYDNIQLVCQWVNMAKGKFSNKDILAVLNDYIMIVK